MTLLEARSLTRTLPGDPPVTLVSDANLTIERGRFTAIIGPSGCGKSSLLYMLGLIDRPSSGTVLFEGNDTGALDRDARARLRLERFGFVFQFHFLLPEFSALENVMLPIRRLGRLSPEATRQRAGDLLASLGLSGKFDKTPDRLSGGERQRVAIARALANDCALILGDEPTGNLDSQNSANVIEILRSLVRDAGKAVVCVTHDPTIASQADVRVSMLDGRVVAIDPPSS